MVILTLEKMIISTTPTFRLLLLMLFVPLLALAQTPAEKENYVLLDDYYKNKQYKKAIAPLNWFLNNKPDFHKNIYIKGYNIYHNLVKKATAAQKEEYQDKALNIYDMRVKYFGEEAKVMNQKGHYAFFYWGRRANKADDLYKLYTKIIELNGNKTYFRSISNYMYMVSQQYQKGNLTGKEVVDIYDRLTKIIDFNMKTNAKDWTEIKTYVDDTFRKVVLSKRPGGGPPLMNCDFISKYYMGDYYKNPNDIKTIKKIISYIVFIRRQNPDAPCGNDSTFVTMSEKLFDAKPTYKGCLLMISLYKKLGNTQKVSTLQNRLPELAETNEEKAEAYYKLATFNRKTGNKAVARKFALKAAQTNAKLAKKAYTLVGDLYYSSGQICTNKNPVLSRAVYIAAYNMYQRAGNASKMASARAQFPRIEKAHEYGMTKGQMISVGCWIGGKVKLMTR